ncbi:hypothetical protein BT96DRAFT_989814 [Gymnopus androsaceus JB14]|uniref:Uncharacterized protein n=1 Tax=Gymnopus androsaceus JB14 TaxID=1447944 RepID=A0A6A4I0G5_9AGAR|nr:hypothetical protein BT96DRAFT_989814 [Gymnopus androsaceus JB14]
MHESQSSTSSAQSSSSWPSPLFSLHSPSVSPPIHTEHKPSPSQSSSRFAPPAQAPAINDRDVVMDKEKKPCKDPQADLQPSLPEPPTVVDLKVQQAIPADDSTANTSAIAGPSNSTEDDKSNIADYKAESASVAKASYKYESAINRGNFVTETHETDS